MYLSEDREPSCFDFMAGHWINQQAWNNVVSGDTSNLANGNLTIFRKEFTHNFHFIPIFQNLNKANIRINANHSRRKSICNYGTMHHGYESKHTTWPNSWKRLTTSENRNNPGLLLASF